MLIKAHNYSLGRMVERRKFEWSLGRIIVGSCLDTHMYVKLLCGYDV